MAKVRFFAQARDAAGLREAELDGCTVGEVLRAAVGAHGGDGGELAQVLEVSAVWLNGEQAEPADPVGPGDEVAILPPVSGGGT